MSDRWPQQAKVLSRNHKSQKACLYPLRSEGISVHNAQLLLVQPGLGTVAKGLFCGVVFLDALGETLWVTSLKKETGFLD